MTTTDAFNDGYNDCADDLPPNGDYSDCAELQDAYCDGYAAACDDYADDYDLAGEDDWLDDPFWDAVDDYYDSDDSYL